MDTNTESLNAILGSIDALSRFVARGCSSMSCDRVRHVWMVNQLTLLGRTAAGLSVETKRALPEVPWDRLTALIDDQTGISSMTDDEMQRFVEQVLPGVRKTLRTAA